MDMKIMTPAQIFVNGKFFCIVDEVEIKRNDPRFKKSILPDNPKLNPDEVVGTVINIIRKPRTKEEKIETEKAKKEGEYDAFFNRMVDATGNEEAHLPIDTSDI